jgi:Protein of unknown function (DUF3592)
MLPFVFIFFIAGIALVIGGRKLERRANEAAAWKVTDGQLLHCEVVDVPSTKIEDPSSSRLNVEYSYVVRGTTYRSTRYAFGQGGTYDDDKLQAIAASLKRSSTITVRYDPKNPTEAVLNTAAPAGIAGIGYLLLGLAVLSALIVLAGR